MPFSNEMNFPGKLSERALLCGALIGKGGFNIRRITQSIGNGAWFTLVNSKEPFNQRPNHFNCDKIKYGAKNPYAVEKLKNIIIKEMNDILNKQTQTKNYINYIHCPKNIAGLVIGKQGYNLKNIKSSIYGWCNISYNEEKFTIKTNNEENLKKIISQLKQIINNPHNFIPKEKQEIFKNKQNKQNKQSSNRFSSLLDESSDDSDEEKEENEVQYQQISKNENINDYKYNNQLRWKIRKEMATWINDDGTESFPAYTITNYKTQQKRTLKNYYAVPWKAVDKEIERRKKIENKKINLLNTKMNKERKQAIQNKNLSKLNEEKSFPSLSLKLSKSKLKQKISIWGGERMKQVRDSKETQLRNLPKKIIPKKVEKIKILTIQNTKPKVVDSWDDDEEWNMNSVDFTCPTNFDDEVDLAVVS